MWLNRGQTPHLHTVQKLYLFPADTHFFFLKINPLKNQTSELALKMITVDIMNAII